MQRLVRHRTPMLAVILAAVLVALSSTLMMLITMGQQEETPVLQEEKLQDDIQFSARTDAKGKAHFGLGILNFFFQAEDGIRDLTVTGVQTCALPISSATPAAMAEASVQPVPCVERVTMR